MHFQKLNQNMNLPQDIIVCAYHRRFVKRSAYFFSPFTPQLFAMPVLLQLPLKPTGRRVYEEVWAVASQILKLDSKFRIAEKHWWNDKEEVLDYMRLGTYNPFCLKIVNRDGFTCSHCHWTQFCAGCVLPPTDTVIEDFYMKSTIAIEWCSHLIEEEYNVSANEVISHESMAEKDKGDESQQVMLDDCMRKFHEVEELKENEQIYCTRCKTHTDHLKNLEIFRPPPVLIVQLKRFKFTQNSRIKLQTNVEFPLYNLDLSTFVTDSDFLKRLDVDTSYDLYGIVNHYGSLSFGHYISVCKNFTDNKWYVYDDSKVRVIDENQINKGDAYILFYIRKDVLAKTLEQVFPSIKSLFPGKPIEVAKGGGFIVEGVNDKKGTIQIKLKDDKGVTEVSENYLLEEKDNDEIEYGEQDMKEIEEQKRKREESIKEKIEETHWSICCCKFRRKKKIAATSTEKQEKVKGPVDGPIIEIDDEEATPPKKRGRKATGKTKKKGKKEGGCGIF